MALGSERRLVITAQTLYMEVGLYLRLQVADHEASDDLLGGEVGEGHLAARAEEEKQEEEQACMLRLTSTVKKAVQAAVGPVLPEIPHARHKLPAPLLLGEAKVCHLQAGHGAIIPRLQLAVQQQIVRLQVGQAIDGTQSHLSTTFEVQPTFGPAGWTAFLPHARRTGSAALPCQAARKHVAVQVWVSAERRGVEVGRQVGDGGGMGVGDEVEWQGGREGCRSKLAATGYLHVIIIRYGYQVVRTQLLPWGQILHGDVAC
ncbi:MAG: hypothetical protein FRX49_10250 [Trebouxia sp. A1-2]|nr:MAG: hypothetical protein FRX49_10250 [Trebouxia sp. A1-2]